MKKIFNKKNRIWIIGGAILLVILFVVFSGRRGSSAGGSTQFVQTGPSEAAQVQMAQIGASLQAQQNELRAAEFQAGVMRDVAFAELETQLGLATISKSAGADELNAQLQALQIQSTTSQNLAAMETEARMFEIAAYRDVTNAATTANYNMFVTQTQANADMFAIQTQATADMFGQQIAAQIRGQELQFDYLNTETLVRRDIDLARVSSQERMFVEQQATERAAISGANKRNKSNNIWGTVGKIAGAVGAIFSDVRAKDNIKQIGETSKGVPLYEYDIGFERQIGVMAQELINYEPSLVSVSPSGLLVVDYSGVYE